MIIRSRSVYKEATASTWFIFNCIVNCNSQSQSSMAEGLNDTVHFITQHSHILHHYPTNLKKESRKPTSKQFTTNVLTL